MNHSGQVTKTTIVAQESRGSKCNDCIERRERAPAAVPQLVTAHHSFANMARLQCTGTTLAKHLHVLVRGTKRHDGHH